MNINLLFIVLFEIFFALFLTDKSKLFWAVLGFFTILTLAKRKSFVSLFVLSFLSLLMMLSANLPILQGKTAKAGIFNEISGCVLKHTNKEICLRTAEGDVRIKATGYQEFLMDASSSLEEKDLLNLLCEEKDPKTRSKIEQMIAFKNLTVSSKVSVKFFASRKGKKVLERLCVIEIPSKKDIHGIISSWKIAIKRILEERLGADNLALTYGILTGEKNYTDSSIAVGFSKLGLAHVLAVSGLHIGIFYGVSRKIFQRIFGSSKATSATSIVVATFFLAFTGFPASGLRAFFMLFVWEVTQLFAYPTHPLDVFLLSVALIISLDPSVVTSISFQFSCLSILSIILLYPCFYKRFAAYLPQSFKNIAELISLVVAVQTGTLLLQFYYFRSISLIGSLSNIVVVPTIPLIMVLSSLIVLFSLIDLEFLATLLSYALKAVLMFVRSSADLFLVLPLSYFHLTDDATENSYQIASCLSSIFFLIVVVTVFKRFSAKTATLALAFIFLIATLANCLVFSCYFFKAGQGSSICISSSFSSVLLDLGPPNFNLYEKVLDFRIKPISAIFISHYHLDHIGGFFKFFSGIKNLPFKPTVYLPPPKSSEERFLFKMFNLYLEKHGFKSEILNEGIYQLPGLKVVVIKPNERSSLDPNERCYLFAIFLRKGGGLKELSVLYPADASSEVLKSIDASAFDWIVASHHGSASGFDEEFYRGFRGRVVVQRGKNSYGLPSKKVIEFFERRRIDWVDVYLSGTEAVLF